MARRNNTDVTSADKKKKPLTWFLVLLHILCFAALLIMCAIVFDSYNDGGRGRALVRKSPAVLMTLVFSFLAGAVGLATMIMAMIHGTAWNEPSRYSTVAANLITFALVALAFGFACKVAHQKPYKGLGSMGDLMIAIIAFDIFLGLGMLLYLSHLGLFKHDDRYDNTVHTTGTHPGAIGSGMSTAGTTTTTGGHKEFVGGHEERAIHA